MDKLMYSKLLVIEKQKKLINEVAKLEKKPTLLVIQVGDNKESNIYIKKKKEACEKIGIEFFHEKLDVNITSNELIKLIERNNIDKNIDGMIVQLPLPDQIDKYIVINRIDPSKDVDGLTLVNIGRLAAGLDSFIPATPYGIVELLKFYNIPISGKRVVIIGRSNLVGRPLANLFLKEDATITICHSKTENIKSVTKEADILVVAVGKKQFVNSDYIKEGAVIVDVGTTKDGKKLYGDVNLDNVLDKCSLITPVPGGVGPMTVISLLENVVKASKKSL